MKKIAYLFIPLVAMTLASCQYKIIDGENQIILSEHKESNVPGDNRPHYTYYLENINHFIVTPVTEKTFNHIGIVYYYDRGYIGLPSNSYHPDYSYSIDNSTKCMHVDINDDFGDRRHSWVVSLGISNKSFYFLIVEKKQNSQD